MPIANGNYANLLVYCLGIFMATVAQNAAMHNCHGFGTGKSWPIFKNGEK